VYAALAREAFAHKTAARVAHAVAVAQEEAREGALIHVTKEAAIAAARGAQFGVSTGLVNEGAQAFAGAFGDRANRGRP
jgi:hypothetical protein